MKLTVSVNRFNEAGQAGCSVELDLPDPRATGQLAAKADRLAARERIRKAYALATWSVNDALARLVEPAPAAARESGSDDDRGAPVAERVEPGPAPPARVRDQWGPGNPAPVSEPGPPTSGKGLYGYLKHQEDRIGEPGILGYINRWAKLQEFPGRMIDWSRAQVAEGYAEARRKMAEVEGAPAELHEEVKP